MRKKILVIHHSGLLGGAGLSLEAMLDALGQEFDVTAYVPERPSALFRQLSERPFNIKTFPGRLAKITIYNGGNRFFSIRFLYHFLKIIPHFIKWLWIIKTENPDLLLVNSRVLCWFALVPSRAVKICFVRETVDSSAPIAERFLVRSLLNKFGARIFLSKFDRQISGTRKENSIVSPDFSEVSKYVVTCKETARTCLGIPRDSFVLVFVGGVDPLKGLSSVIKSVDIMATRYPDLHRKFYLIVCGDISANSINTYRDIYDAKDLRLVIGAMSGERREYINIRWLGLLADLSEVYSAADALIFPMRKAHQARPAFEIGYFAKPVLISSFENVREFFQDGYNALEIDAENPSFIVEAVRRLMTDPELLESLGRNNLNESLRVRNSKSCMAPVINICHSLAGVE